MNLVGRSVAVLGAVISSGAFTGAAEPEVKLNPFVVSAMAMPKTTEQAIVGVEGVAKEEGVALPPKDVGTLLSFVVVSRPFSPFSVRFSMTGTVKKPGPNQKLAGGKISITRSVPLGRVPSGPQGLLLMQYKTTSDTVDLTPDQAASVIWWFEESKFLNAKTAPGGLEGFDGDWLYIELLYEDKKLAFIRTRGDPETNLFDAKVRAFEVWSRPR